jgi:hypothetical protein
LVGRGCHRFWREWRLDVVGVMVLGRRVMATVGVADLGRGGLVSSWFGLGVGEGILY